MIYLLITAAIAAACAVAYRVFRAPPTPPDWVNSDGVQVFGWGTYAARMPATAQFDLDGAIGVAFGVWFRWARDNGKEPALVVAAFRLARLHILDSPPGPGDNGTTVGRDSYVWWPSNDARLDWAWFLRLVRHELAHQALSALGVPSSEQHATMDSIGAP